MISLKTEKLKNPSEWPLSFDCVFTHKVRDEYWGSGVILQREDAQDIAAWSELSFDISNFDCRDTNVRLENGDLVWDARIFNMSDYYAGDTFTVRGNIVLTFKQSENYTSLTHYPVMLEQRLDRELDSGSFDFLRHDTNCSDQIDAPLSKYRITLSDDDNSTEVADFIGTDTRALLRGKFGNGKTKDTAPIFRHSVMLTEPTKLLEGVLIDGFAVTQPEEIAQGTSLHSVVTRLFETVSLCKDDDSLPTFSLCSNPDMITLLLNTVSPQFKWNTQTTLWECLCDVGSVIDAIPRLTASADYRYIYVDFDLVNSKAAEITQLLDAYTFDYGEEVDDSQYNSQLRSVVENIKEE